MEGARRLVVFSTLVLLAGCEQLRHRPPQSRPAVGVRTFALDEDVVWDRAVQWFAANAELLQVDNIDRSSGVIAASNKGRVDPALLDVGTFTFAGEPVPHESERHAMLFTVKIRGDGSSTEVHARVTGYFEVTAGSAVGFDQSLSGVGVSTGALEASLLAFVKG